MGKKSTGLLVFVLIVLILTGCKKSSPLDPKNPVTLTLWHPYEQRMRVNMDELINEFNSTVGAARGIIVRDSFVAETAEISKALISAAGGVPGAPALPDIAVVYPGIAIIMAENGLLVDLTTSFNKAELSGYIPEFLEEGMLDGDALYIMPIAKSTEVIFVNSTIFNRFAAEVDGVELSRLATFEGILEIAEKYYEWSGGKAFMYYSDLFNYTLTAFNQLGGNFLEGNSYNVSSPIFQRVWDGYFPLAVKGGLAIFHSFGSHLMATGETVCILDTTASVSFLSNTVTYPDNTKENYELEILPYPVFEGGRKVSVQQGGGMCVFKSDVRKEYAAAVFLKWFTEPEQNLRFTVDIGYMPVTVQAFNEFISLDLITKQSPGSFSGKNITKLLDTVIEMQRSYRFHYPPVLDGIEAMRWDYARALRTAAENTRQDYLKGAVANHQTMSSDVMKNFITSIR
jgi:multiple sugar transport system substrate-binding protein